MNRMLATLAATLVPLCVAAQGGASTPTIWRCGADGRSYSDTPCTDGRAHGTVDVAAARPQSDVDDAFARSRREQQVADRMRAERLPVEAADAAALRKAQAAALKAAAAAQKAALKPTGLQPAPQRHPRRHGRQTTADDGIFRAVAPASRPTKG